MPPTPATGAPRPGGGAGAAALRARIESEGFAGYIGPEAYSAYMRWLRKKAPEDLPAIGGRAAHQALLRQLGEDGYRDRQRAGFEAACAKHGRAVILEHVERAHEERRIWRLDNPTPAERALHATLRGLGFAFHTTTHYTTPIDGFDFHRWRRLNTPELSARDMIAEARVGRYFVDVLLPALSVAIEVNGGIHCLRPEHDATREAYLRGLGLNVYTFTNDEVIAGIGGHLASLIAL